MLPDDPLIQDWDLMAFRHVLSLMPSMCIDVLLPSSLKDCLSAVPDASPSTEGDAIRVVVRLRKPEEGVSGHEHSICMNVDGSGTAVVMHSKPDPKIFTFDKIIDTNAAQVCMATFLFQLLY